MTAPLPTVIVDDREKHPMHHYDGILCRYETRRLSTGDYALKSMCREIPGKKTLEPRFAVERKGCGDWLSSWHGLVRDKRKKLQPNSRKEIKKIQCGLKNGFVMPYVLDCRECDLHAAIQREPWRIKFRLRWSAVKANIKRLRDRGLPVIFGKNRKGSELIMLNLIFEDELTRRK